MTRRTLRFAPWWSEGVTGGSVRHSSIQGRSHTRGAPPATRRAKSFSALGLLPGASALMTRPSNRTPGTAPEAHCFRASWAERRPSRLVRHVRITGTSPVEELAGTGHAWCASHDPSNSAASVLSPEPPCVPTHHNLAFCVVGRSSKPFPSGSPDSGWGRIGPVGVIARSGSWSWREESSVSTSSVS